MPLDSGVQNRLMTSPSGDPSSNDVDHHVDSPAEDIRTTASDSAAYGQSRRTWNYRVMSFKHGEDAWQAIHEVHYRDGRPTAYSSSAAVVMWDTDGGSDAGLWVLDRMKEALSKPVLTESDFPNVEGTQGEA